MVARSNFGAGIGHLLRAALNVAHQIHQTLLHIAQGQIELPQFGLAHVVDMNGQVALGKFLGDLNCFAQGFDDAVGDD